MVVGKIFLNILSFIYLFLIRLRFPTEQSIAEVIRKRYGDINLAKIRKFEKLDFRRRKTQLDITFLELCVEKDIMPNFVRFYTANQKLGNSDFYLAKN